jgi:hypothetical protein
MVRFGSALACVLVMLLSAAAGAQEVGTIAEVEGTAEIGRAGVWAPAQAAATIHAREELRTGRPGRMRVLLQDESVLNLSDDSYLIIDEQIIDADRGLFRSAMRLMRGKVRAVVSAKYQGSQALFAIETATAVSSVRGTEFIIAYDPVAELTEVVGVSGTVEVHSVLDRTGRGVFITANEVTTVSRGQLPTRPRRLDEATFRQYIEGLEFIGAGRPESLIGARALSLGTNVPALDRADAVALPRGPIRALAPVVPGEFPQPDASGSTKQPIPVLQSSPGKLGLEF